MALFVLNATLCWLVVIFICRNFWAQIEYLGKTVTNKDYILREIKNSLYTGNPCYQLLPNLKLPHLLIGNFHVNHPRNNNPQWVKNSSLFFIAITSRLRLKCDGTRAETRFRLWAKRASPFKSAGASVQSNTGSQSVRIRGSNAGYTMFRGNVKSTGYTLHSPISPSLPLPCVTVCHHISTGLYLIPRYMWTVQTTENRIVQK